MYAQSLTPRCLRPFQKKDHVCFGISPFNSYFSEEKIKNLVAWGKQEFMSMHVFVPDVPSAYTLEALGYSSEKAAWKARRQCQYLLNKITRALQSVGVAAEEIQKTVLTWEKLAINEHYLHIYRQVKDLFEQNRSFYEACLEAL